MSGPPGSGKTTYCKKQMELIKQKDPEAMIYHISRDAIRFSILEEGEEYFAKEEQVKQIFFSRILFCFLNWEHCYVFADATFLSPKYRKNFLEKLFKLLPEAPAVCAVNFKTDLNTCIAQNNMRTGRERVPEEVLTKMYYRYIPPTEKEYPYERILVIKNE